MTTAKIRIHCFPFVYFLFFRNVLFVIALYQLNEWHWHEVKWNKTLILWYTQQTFESPNGAIFPRQRTKSRYWEIRTDWNYFVWWIMKKYIITMWILLIQQSSSLEWNSNHKHFSSGCGIYQSSFVVALSPSWF